MAPIRQYGLYGFTLQRALEARGKLGNESKQPRLKTMDIDDVRGVAAGIGAPHAASLRQRHGILRLRCELVSMKHLLACLATLAAFNVTAQDWDANNDVDQDGCVGVGDVLQILSVFGSCEPTWQCGDTLEYDNYWYETVLIADQCWFAENLRTTTYLNGDAIPASLTDGDWSSTTSGATAVYGEDSGCNNYSPDIDACDEALSLAEYGRLYNWYAVDDARGLCPSGWHVPTDGEWTDLENHISSQGYSGTEGTALKSTYGWYNGGNGTDDFGFSALPGGFRGSNNGYFYDAGNSGAWWSSSPSGGDAWYRYLIYGSPDFYRSDFFPRVGFSVRCLRDAE